MLVYLRVWICFIWRLYIRMRWTSLYYIFWIFQVNDSIEALIYPSSVPSTLWLHVILHNCQEISANCTKYPSRNQSSILFYTIKAYNFSTIHTLYLSGFYIFPPKHHIICFFVVLISENTSYLRLINTLICHLWNFS